MARPSTSSTATARAKPAARRNALPGRLSPGMVCDTAFRIIARRHLDAVLAQHDGTCRGDPEALHQIRIALTHLRTAIRFFSPMVDDALRPEVWTELKWLNSQLGMVRDLDVAIERVIAESGGDLTVIAELQHWDEKRAESHRLLARALQSARYRHLVEQTSAWIESGSWSTRSSKEAIRLRRCTLADHATAKLTEWEKTLLKKARKLRKLDVEKRHKLRLLNKRSDLFDRVARGPVRRRVADKAEVDPQAIAQGAKIPRTIERRCARANPGGVVERGRPRGGHSLPQSQARKETVADRLGRLPETRQGQAVPLRRPCAECGA